MKPARASQAAGSSSSSARIAHYGTVFAEAFRNRRGIRAIAALTSGALVASAYPPVDWTWFIWVALVPLLMAVHHSARPREAALHGLVAGTTACLIALYPLLSASAWTGWALVTTEELLAMRGRQWWFLHALWVVLGVWGGVFWAIFAAVLKAWRPVNAFVLVILACALWILVPEWLRTQVSWGFHWILLGNATVDFDWIRQLAAIGGVWLLSALVVAVNVAVYVLTTRQRRAGHWGMPMVVAVLLVAVCAGGAMRIAEHRGSSPPLVSAILQFHQTDATDEDYLPFGMQRAYRDLIDQTLDKLGRDLRLLVLPESVGFGNVSLDGTRSTNTPSKPHFDVAPWNETITRLLGDRGTLLMLGLDTAQRGHSYNTMLAWSKDGLVGHYDKRELVPFAEYQPNIPRETGVRGISQYEHGSGSQLIRHDDLVIGTFICQEVLFPHVARDAVRDGANLLVSGGNDGVFGNPAVAQIHAKLAQLRATETDRYLVRAMKTGVSAVLSPTGHELARSPSSRPVLLRANVDTRASFTPYSRFGDWPVLLAALCLAVLLVIFPRAPG